MNSTDGITIKKTHSGQYKKYGDSFDVWEVTTENRDMEEVAKLCFEATKKCPVPPYGEYSKRSRYGTGDMAGNADYHFAGYYTLAPTNTGYTFTICSPYCD